VLHCRAASRLYRILIVEDDPGVTILQRRRLERAGFSVVVANDLDAALATLDRGGIGIVLLDYRLGESTAGSASPHEGERA
jgi:DNA-binding response OmpR family regulator